jgi:hypothetical protein
MKKLLCLIAVCLPVRPCNAGELSRHVRAVDWNRFAEPVPLSDELRASSAIVANGARYAHTWADSFYESSPSDDRYLIANQNQEKVIRPPASAAVGLAVALKTGVDPRRMGASRAAITRCAVKLIKGVAAVHKVNGGRWGDHWQSTLWAAQLGRAAWMLWDDLDSETREMVSRAVVHEADRHIRPGYKIKYWVAGSGNTRAEENSWDSMVLQQAAAMMPEHPHADRWREICSKLQISAYSRESDRARTEPLLDGKSPREWLDGFNVREDGLVINHGRIHNDYMCSMAHLQMSGYMVFSLAEQPVPETLDFNFDLIYRTMVTRVFDSPPYEAPGGTMYIPGTAQQYYPQGTDWSPLRFASFYGMDSLADVLGFDRGLPHTAAHWRALRAGKIFEMQSRHADGHMYAPDEYDHYFGAEQMVFWMMSDAHLLQWLADHDALSPKKNWIRRDAGGDVHEE